MTIVAKEEYKLTQNCTPKIHVYSIQILLTLNSQTPSFLQKHTMWVSNSFLFQTSWKSSKAWVNTLIVVTKFCPKKPFHPSLPYSLDST